ncbi:acyltransferase [Alsobacter soli]|uniref:acyltransferase n=1 Tax=Alsobacter soli TaxID=2109933 RepID=UPI001AECEA79|nr:acyltransferase [Alsobacter soli]
MGGIHPTAVVSSRAQVADSASVGPFTIINDDVVVGEGAEVGSHCELGVATSLAKQPRLVIGPGSLVRSHSRIYQGSDFGGGLTTGHAVTIRENVVAGARLQLGSQSILDGDCVLGDHVRIHTNVFVTKNSVVGSFVWIFSSVLLTDDPHPPSHLRLGVTIHDFAVLAAGCAVLPGVVLGRGCLVGCRALVTKDVPEGMVAVGAPAELRGPVSALPRRDGSGEPAYPWTAHYHRGYPEEVVRDWVAAAGRDCP